MQARPPEPLRSDVPLAPFTTLELGGRARHFLRAAGDADVCEGLRWARAKGLDATVLGGGSNLVVADRGFDGLVIQMAQRGIAFRPCGERVEVRARAGEPWDPFVAETVARGLAGLECLSGIPGLVGATPIQNVGAYGQEVSDTIASVRVLDRETLKERFFDPQACEFEYRQSRFKRDPDRFVVLDVTFLLRAGGAPTIRYAELERALTGDPNPSVALVRDTVLSLRRKKSMVLDPNDDNRRSAGSFFTNPILTDEEADRVVARAMSQGVVKDPSEVPRYPAGPGRSKLAAGWLVERSGMVRGTRRNHVGISSSHTLALVHHGGGTTAELLELAREVRQAVHDRFGVTLDPEPVLLGFAERPLA